MSDQNDTTLCTKLPADPGPIESEREHCRTVADHLGTQRCPSVPVWKVIESERAAAYRVGFAAGEAKLNTELTALQSNYERLVTAAIHYQRAAEHYLGGTQQGIDAIQELRAALPIGVEEPGGRLTLSGTLMSDPFEILQRGADGVTYRLNVTHYKHWTIDSAPSRRVDTYSYRISDPRQDGKYRTLEDDGLSGALPVNSFEAAKTEALGIFKKFLSSRP